MTPSHDPFRPRGAVAAAIYDALLAETGKRKTRPGLTWIDLELNAVHAAVVEQARIHGWTAPTKERIQQIERSAMGHVDYASKWSHYVAEELVKINKQEAARADIGVVRPGHVSCRP